MGVGLPALYGLSWWTRGCLAEVMMTWASEAAADGSPKRAMLLPLVCMYIYTYGVR